MRAFYEFGLLSPTQQTLTCQSSTDPLYNSYTCKITATDGIWAHLYECGLSFDLQQQFTASSINSNQLNVADDIIPLSQSTAGTPTEGIIPLKVSVLIEPTFVNNINTNLSDNSVTRLISVPRHMQEIIPVFPNQLIPFPHIPVLTIDNQQTTARPDVVTVGKSTFFITTTLFSSPQSPLTTSSTHPQSVWNENGAYGAKIQIHPQTQWIVQFSCQDSEFGIRSVSNAPSLGSCVVNDKTVTCTSINQAVTMSSDAKIEFEFTTPKLNTDINIQMSTRIQIGTQGDAIGPLISTTTIVVPPNPVSYPVATGQVFRMGDKITFNIDPALLPDASIVDDEISISIYSAVPPYSHYLQTEPVNKGEFTIVIPPNISPSESVRIELTLINNNNIYRFYPSDQFTISLQCKNNSLPNDECTQCGCNINNQDPATFFVGKECDECGLKCLNQGSINTKCTQCTCPRQGYSGVRCQCRDITFTMTLSSIPAKIVSLDDPDSLSSQTAMDYIRSQLLLQPKLKDLSATLFSTLQITKLTTIMNNNNDNDNEQSQQLKIDGYLRDNCDVDDTNNYKDLQSKWSSIINSLKKAGFVDDNDDVIGIEVIESEYPDINCDSVYDIDCDGQVNGGVGVGGLNSYNTFTISIVVIGLVFGLSF
jgi:hypothetical protein